MATQRLRWPRTRIAWAGITVLVLSALTDLDTSSPRHLRGKCEIRVVG